MSKKYVSLFPFFCNFFLSFDALTNSQFQNAELVHQSTDIFDLSVR